MKKFKEIIACILLTGLFVGIFYISIQIKAGEMTKPQGVLIMVSVFLAVSVICEVLTKGDK